MPKGKTTASIKRVTVRAIPLLLIKFYQSFLSPLKPATCRFYPTCSQYCYEAVLKYGIIQGGLLGIRRILKCHPFHRGGYDPLD